MDAESVFPTSSRQVSIRWIDRLGLDRRIGVSMIKIATTRETLYFKSLT